MKYINKVPRVLNLLVNVTPGFEVVLEKEIKSLFKANQLLVPKIIKRHNGSLEFTVPQHADNLPFQNTISKSNNKKDRDEFSREYDGSKESKEQLLYLSKYLWVIGNCSRLTESVRIRVGKTFVSKSFKQFKDFISQPNNYNQFVAMSREPPSAAVSCHQSVLYHSNAVKERFLDFFNKECNDAVKKRIFELSKPIKKKLKSLRKEKKNVDREARIASGNGSKKVVKEEEDEDDEEEDDEEEDYQIKNAANGKKVIDYDKEIEKLEEELNNILREANTQDQSKLYIRLDSDSTQISVDALVSKSGQLHYKRSNDKHIGDAPIRETIANAVLKTINFNGKTSSLWDPFCGSGTFIQEGLSNLKYSPSMTTNAPRKLHFESFSWHLKNEYEKYLNEINNGMATLDNGIYYIGSDISQKAIDASYHNLRNEGYSSVNSDLGDRENRLKLFKGDFEDVYKKYISKLMVSDQVASNSQAPLTIVANLPYGLRLLNSSTSQEDILEHEREIFNTLNTKNYFYLNDHITNELSVLFKRFGQFLNDYAACNNSIIQDVYIVNGNLYFQNLSTNNNQFNFKWDEVLKFKNGGLTVELLKLNKNK